MRRIVMLGGLLALLATGCDSAAVGAFPPPDPTLVAENEGAGDEYGGRFPIAEAVEGLPAEGDLWATLSTGEGRIHCKLDASGAPLTVANFVGLARGLRPFAAGPSGPWIREPFYDGTIFHRALEGQMVQGGRRGDAPRPGFRIQDEIRVGEAFDRSGVLAMANDGQPSTGGAQFFITTAALRELDGMHTIFGRCGQPTVVRALERAVLGGGSPTLDAVTISRGEEPPG